MSEPFDNPPWRWVANAVALAIAAWLIYAGLNRALAGHYGGASGEATVGAGVGANVLVGGSNRTVTLQPLSVQGQAGLNVAVGVASLDLRPAR